MIWARAIALKMASLVAAPTLAHAPVRDEGHYALTREDPFVIVEPEISKACYMELTGAPHVYRIDSPKAFDFYAGLLQPKLEGCPMTRTFSLELLDESFRRIDWVDGSADRWTAFFERFARDWYWKGPEIGLNNRSTRFAQQGTCYLCVFNADNRGKYVLAVGDTKWFHFQELIHMPEMIRWMNEEIWDPSDCEAH